MNNQHQGASCIGILAHVDAGKTTLSEQLLFQSGAIRSAGRVDHQSAFMDWDDLERQRGITIYTGAAPFDWNGRSFFLLDTPGHSDFSGEMQRALRVLDCAVLVVDAVKGIQSHTAAIWRLLREERVPTLIFLNKTDQPGADPEAVIASLRQRWEMPCIPWGDNPACWAEELAMLDDGLTERYLERFDPADEDESAFWWEEAACRFAEQAFLPVLRGAALKGEGVGELLGALALLAPQLPAGGAFSGQVYRIVHDRQGRRMACIKVLSGVLTAKAPFAVPETDETGAFLQERAEELRRPVGGKSQPVSEVYPGELCLVAGLKEAVTGDRIGEAPRRAGEWAIQPLLAAEVCPGDGLPQQKLLSQLRLLEDEDPLLSVEWEEHLSQISLRVMGRLQLDVLRETLLRRFGSEVTFGRPRVLYRETLTGPVHGCGHFEPLRHYAEVHLRLEPGERGSGIVFDSACLLNDLSRNWQNLIRTHVLEKEHRGVLTGMPVTDLRITLLAGRAHLKHTEGGDFREATYRAVRHGLMKAREAGMCLLLEPWYGFRMELPASLAGRALSDLEQMKGEVSATEPLGDLTRISGAAPAAGMMDYPDAFTSFTRGKGTLELWFGGYRPCRDTDAVVEAIGYQPERDLDNPPGSVFCSHGAGFTVGWREAEGMMHLRVNSE